jgi:hypothetical protein
MKDDGLKKYLSRRILKEEGWCFFCRICGTYLPEDQFYKSSQSKWGVDTKCKIHYTRKDKNDDSDCDHLKLDPLTENDFIQTQLMLERLGYKFNSEETIHEQFKKKYGLP